MKIKKLFFVLLFGLLLTVTAASGGTRRSYNNTKHTKQRYFSQTFKINKKSSIPLAVKSSSSHRHQELLTKKSEIEAATLALENGVAEKKDKRGFLANLANLLNDAESLSGHKNLESGMSSISHTDEKTNTESTGIQNIKEIDQNTEEIKYADAAKKEDINLRNLKEIQDQVNSSDKDFAPIFAMYHGKIVPLGKLPDSSFRKSHTEEAPTKTINTTTTIDKMSEKTTTHDNAIKRTNKIVDITGARRSFSKQNLHITPEGDSISDEKSKKDVDPKKLSKLQQYLINLDEHTPATAESKDVKAVAKDEVVFPEDETGTSKSDIINHVKGVVLDNGKIVSVNNHAEIGDESSKQTADPNIPDSQQKFFVSDDGTLTPLTKSKPEVGETVTRDVTINADGQKTVALSLDVLKDLLKKTDSKISLASLLNKSPETKSDTPSQEEEDPGTIEDFAAGGLKAHNIHRIEHHDQALVWSDDLAAKAQKLAESLADRKTLEIAKDLEKDGYGENVAKVWATFKNAGEAATKMWYSQSENYRFDDPHLDENTGQFAQLVWKSTKELGMGVAKSIDDVNNKYVYVTALYRPPGNIEAILRDNVLPTGNNTVDVYTTFFKRAGVSNKLIQNEIKRSKLPKKYNHLSQTSSYGNIVDEKD